MIPCFGISIFHFILLLRKVVLACYTHFDFKSKMYYLEKQCFKNTVFLNSFIDIKFMYYTFQWYEMCYSMAFSISTLCNNGHTSFRTWSLPWKETLPFWATAVPQLPNLPNPRTPQIYFVSVSLFLFLFLFQKGIL